MGAVASQPAVNLPAGSQAALNVNRLASLASRYEQLKRDFAALGDEQEEHAGSLKEQRELFRRQLSQFQKDFENKLNEQQKRNADLNARERNVAARNSALRERLAALEVKQAANQSAAANAKAAAIQAATQAATAERLRLEQSYQKELAELQAPLKNAREEFSRITQELGNLQLKLKEKSEVNAAVATARTERTALNTNIKNRRNSLTKLNKNIQNQTAIQAKLVSGISENTQRQGKLAQNLDAATHALDIARVQIAQQIKEEEAKLPAKLKELEEDLAKQIQDSRVEQLNALKLELDGIRKGEQEKIESLLAEAQAKATQELAKASKEIADLRAKDEADRTERLTKENEELERQKQAVAKERADTEAAIKALEARAATNSAAAEKLKQERAELDRIKAEQAEFAAEKARILAEQTAARDAAATAKQEAAAARANAEKALREKAIADKERIKAEKVEKYRKHIYQIIKDWIGPLERDGVRTFHDDAKDDYYFDFGTSVKPWIDEARIKKLAKKYPGLKWQPRPSFNTFVGGRRSTRRTRNNQRKTRKY